LDFAQPLTFPAIRLNGKPNSLQPFTVRFKPFQNPFILADGKALVVVFPFQVTILLLEKPRPCAKCQNYDFIPMVNGDYWPKHR